ncbi:MAG: glycosyltransferase family 2 protein [Pseudomonadales bacterium]|nr:glycosyltransferase family 2 protein [Pseudomonadales bacterium]
MKFSIIVPTYNRAYILRNLIRSVLNQTYNDWELLIVDDGSTDSTKEVVKKISDKRIIFLEQENQGPSAARNYALSKSTGKWIAYIDSDNELLSNYLDVLLIFIQKNPEALFSITKGIRTLELFENDQLVDIIDDSDNYPKTVSVEDVYTRKVKFDINGFAHSKKIYNDDYQWNEDLSLMEDWDFFMQFADKYKDGLVYINIPVFHYHQRFGTDGLVSNASYKDWAKAFETIYQRHKNSKYIKNQEWYPQRVEKYIQLAVQEKKGEAKPAYLKYFPNFVSS